jgi:Tn3 transposase DDE domain
MGAHGGQVADPVIQALLAISGSLTLLTNMVMAWTTQRMQQVLDRWQRTGTRRVEPDLLRHIGPMHFQNINFRGEMAFPLARYRSRLIPGLSAKTGHEPHGTDGS